MIFDKNYVTRGLWKTDLCGVGKCELRGVSVPYRSVSFSSLQRHESSAPLEKHCQTALTLKGETLGPCHPRGRGHSPTPPPRLPIAPSPLPRRF